MLTIRYLGNEFVKEDYLAIKVASDLSEKLKGKAEFVRLESLGDMMEIEDDQVFMDVCEGIDKIRIVTDPDDFETVMSTSAHDLDFGFFLKLAISMGKISKATIICLPQEPYDGLENEVSVAIRQLLKERGR